MQTQILTLSMILAALGLHADPVTVLSTAETVMPLSPATSRVRWLQTIGAGILLTGLAHWCSNRCSSLHSRISLPPSDGASPPT
jgi:hypothetical protein